MPSFPKDTYRNTNQYAPIGERHNKPLTIKKGGFCTRFGQSIDSHSAHFEGASVDALIPLAPCLPERRASQVFTNHFGIEIEFTGITRSKAAEIAAQYLNGTVSLVGDYYDTHKVTAADGRVWKFMYDGSIVCQCRSRGQIISASNTYSVELVSPILLYRQDIGILQGLVRALRRAGGFANPSCGIHVHLDGANHTPRSIRNFINIIASHNDLFYKALQIPPQRMSYCKKMDAYLVKQMNLLKPQTFDQIETIWYE